MNDYTFYNCRVFLEAMIQNHPDNNELIQAYVKLIEKKTEFDIAYFSQDAEIRKNWDNNQMEMNKAWQNGQTEIVKKQIEVRKY
jgi:hypothetical protein